MKVDGIYKPITEELLRSDYTLRLYPQCNALKHFWANRGEVYIRSTLNLVK